METGGNRQGVALKRLREALDEQRTYLALYEKPSEPVVYETLRRLDDLFCRDLMEPERSIEKDERPFRSLSTWDINLDSPLVLRPRRQRNAHVQDAIE